MTNPEQAPETFANPNLIEAVPGAAPASTAQSMGELAVPAIIDAVPGMTSDVNSTSPSREVVTVSQPGDPGHEKRVAGYLAGQEQYFAMQQAAVKSVAQGNER